MKTVIEALSEGSKVLLGAQKLIDILHTQITREHHQQRWLFVMAIQTHLSESENLI